MNEDVELKEKNISGRSEWFYDQGQSTVIKYISQSTKQQSMKMLCMAKEGIVENA